MYIFVKKGVQWCARKICPYIFLWKKNSFQKCREQKMEINNRYRTYVLPVFFLTQCCGSKYSEFGSGSRILDQFLLKIVLQKEFLKKTYFFKQTIRK